jgi:hypothetical protein
MQILTGIFRRSMASASVFVALTFLSTSLFAQDNWLTIAGDSTDPITDYIQFNPAEIGKEGGLVTIPLRVSRSQERVTQDGIKFRSFVAVAGVDCTQRTARFLRATFYMEPGFHGSPHQTKEYGAVVRPVLFRQIPGDYAERTIRATCKSGK